MTVREALAEGRLAMKQHESSTADLDTSLLLSHICKLEREYLYMRLSESLDNVIIEEYRLAMKRRISGEPVAWIIGKKEFWGRRFSVGPGIFCPRPDTEMLIEATLKTMGEYGPKARLHDCCCGPGTLALTLAAERPDWDISASDISLLAERYFKKNNQAIINGKAKYFHSDLLENVPGQFEIIVSNPPYLTPAEFCRRKKLMWREPELSLNGKNHDGLNIIRRLITHVRTRIVRNGTFLLEASPIQMYEIHQLLSDNGFENIRYSEGIDANPHVVIARKRL